MYFFTNNTLFKAGGIMLVGTLLFGCYVVFNILLTNLESEEFNEIDNYIDIKKKKFYFVDNRKDLNKNIQAEFYNKEKYNSIISTNNNILESSWKQRILFENTPRGNVIMYFDAYKMGFAYYSDSNVPYNILNAVAMKYVVMFYCRDFFLDKSIILSDKTPFQYIHEIDLKDNKKKEIPKGPFAKFKNYSKDKEKEKEKEKDKDNEKDKEKHENANKPKDYIKNKFICKGKIREFSFLKDKRVKTSNKVLKPISYNNFKQWHNPSNEDVNF